MQLRDRIYFIRADGTSDEFLEVRVYDMDTRAGSSHDHLVGSIPALEEYVNYLDEKLKAIEKLH